MSRYWEGGSCGEEAAASAEDAWRRQASVQQGRGTARELTRPCAAQ